MEIAKFVLYSIGSFVSVFTLSFSIFQYWKKKQEDKYNAFKTETKESLQRESEARQRDINKLEKRIENLENTFVHSVEHRMSNIEGELKSMRPILQSIQDWFINKTPRG